MDLYTQNALSVASVWNLFSNVEEKWENIQKRKCTLKYFNGEVSKNSFCKSRKMSLNLSIKSLRNLVWTHSGFSEGKDSATAVPRIPCRPAPFAVFLTWAWFSTVDDVVSEALKWSELYLTFFVTWPLCSCSNISGVSDYIMYGQNNTSQQWIFSFGFQSRLFFTNLTVRCWG